LGGIYEAKPVLFGYRVLSAWAKPFVGFSLNSVQEFFIKFCRVSMNFVKNESVKVTH